MTNRKSQMRFRLTPRLMTLNDLEQPYVRIFSQFRVISLMWEAIGLTATQTKSPTLSAR